MGGHPGFYKSGKRNKELARQKKQEEKKLRRLNKAQSPEGETLDTAQEAPISEEVTKGSEE
jgi:hypothetical protein